MWVEAQKGWRPRTKQAYIYWWKRWQTEFGKPSQTSIDHFLAAYPNLPARATCLAWKDFTRRKDIDIPKRRGHAARRIQVWLTHEEVWQLIAWCEANNRTGLGLMIRLAFEGGIRIGELTDLTVSNVMWTARNIRFIGKGDVEAIVDFSPDTEPHLKSWIEVNKLGPDDRLFPMSTGSGYNKVHSVGLKVLGKLIGPHTFRHSLTTYLLDVKKLPVNQVRDYLRHKNLETTNRYSHAKEEDTHASIRQALM